MQQTRYWTSYWREEHWGDNVEFEPVNFSGGSFKRRGVSVGDVVYVISQHSGQLLLGGRLVVGAIVRRDEAVRLRKREDLYDVAEWVVAREGSGTPLHHRRQLSTELTKELRFISSQSKLPRPLHFTDRRSLDRQTTRGVRQLTHESAILLDLLIEKTDNELRLGVPTSTVSKRGLRQYALERQLGMAPHEEIGSIKDYVEGSVREVLVNQYERDVHARADCIRHHGVGCSVCGAHMKDAYGAVAADFIHVHHVRPLSTLRQSYVVDPVKDLRPVCPNCHAIIHRRNPPYTIEEVKGFLGTARSNGK